MRELQYIVMDETGIHARPAGLLAKEASRFQSEIRMTKGEQIADAKRIFSIMGLAVKHKELISITIEGEDEEEAIVAMEKFLKANL